MPTPVIQMTIRVPADLYERLKDLTEPGQMNSWAVQALEKQLKREEKKRHE